MRVWEHAALWSLVSPYIGLATVILDIIALNQMFFSASTIFIAGSEPSTLRFHSSFASSRLVCSFVVIKIDWPFGISY